MRGGGKQRKQSLLQVERSRQKGTGHVLVEKAAKMRTRERKVAWGGRTGLSHPAETLPGCRDLTLLPSVDIKDRGSWTSVSVSSYFSVACVFVCVLLLHAVGSQEVVLKFGVVEGREAAGRVIAQPTV